jgi:hypothetical protein
MLTYPENAEVLEAPGMRSIVVEMVENAGANHLARKKVIKAGNAHSTTTMKGVQ